MRQAWWKHILLFFVFSILAAPSEFHLDWYFGYRSGLSLATAIETPLLHGVLFFYALVMSTETLMRLHSAPGVEERLAVTGLRMSCAIPIAIFFIEFAPRQFAMVPADALSVKAEWFAAALSLLISTIAHVYLSRQATWT